MATNERAVLPGAGGQVVDPALADDGQGGVMTLREHVLELRNRLVKSGLALLVGCAVGFYLSAPLLGFLARQLCATGVPPEDCRLVIIDPTEGMMTSLRVSLYVGVAVALPVIAFQLVRFMAPGLTRREKRMLYTSLPFVGILFVGGSAFALFVVLPAMLNFLSTWEASIYRSEIRAAATVSIGLTVTLWMGLIFETPLVMVILARLQLVDWRKMLGFWRYAIVFILIVAAIVTPTPDPINMMLVATPMLFLYFLGVLLARLFGGRPSMALAPA